MRKLIFGILIIVMLLAIGCSSQQTTTPTTNKQPTAGGNLGIKQDVEISGFAFNPQSVTVPKGATVIWTNKDSAVHTIVADGGEFSSPSTQQAETFAHTFNAAGTYEYHCGIHPSMKGTIVVE